MVQRPNQKHQHNWCEPALGATDVRGLQRSELASDVVLELLLIMIRLSSLLWVSCTKCLSSCSVKIKVGGAACSVSTMKTCAQQLTLTTFSSISFLLSKLKIPAAGTLS